jgi:transposase InsO family protein
MQANGYRIGRHGILKLLKAQGLKAIQPRSFVPKTTQSKHGLIACPNLLKADFACIKPNQVWVSDITYIPLKDGKWAYLAAWMEWLATAVIHA